MNMQRLFKNSIFLFMKEKYLKYTQRKMYCVICYSATKRCLVESRSLIKAHTYLADSPSADFNS